MIEPHRNRVSSPTPATDIPLGSFHQLAIAISRYRRMPPRALREVWGGCFFQL